MVLDNLLDPVLGPILTLPPLFGIIIVSFIVTVLSTLAYKYLTDQKKMKALRVEMKSYQTKIKKLSKEEPEKAMKVQQEMMGKNMELMKQSFKPMLFTLLPLLIIYGWLGAHMAYEPLMPGEAFDVTLELEKMTEEEITFSSIPGLSVSKDNAVNQVPEDDMVSWTLRGDAGEYTLKFSTTDGTFVTKDIIISDERGTYANPVEKLNEKPFKNIVVSNEKIKPMQGAPLIGGFGWLGTYIILSVIFSLVLRKLMKVA